MTKKKTDKEFKREVFELVGDEYTVLSEYRTTHEHVLMRHNTCGHEYLVKPSKFLTKRRCPKCRRPNYNRDTSQFKREVFELVGDEYTVLGEYKNTDTPILMKHNECEHIYQVRPGDFLRTNRCPKCAHNQKKTTEQFKSEVYNLVGDEYAVLGEYIKSGEYILMRHNACGHKYQVTPSAFLQKTRCSNCFGNPKKTTEQFKDEVYNLVGDEYTVLEEYKNTDTPILMRHNKCKHEYKVRPYSFLGKTRCPRCFGNPKKTTEQFKDEVYNLVGDEYTVLEEYKNTDTPILMKHNVCENEYKVRPGKFLYGTRCPVCSSSRGETSISSFLNKYSINYKYNISYGGCRHKEPLRFDFLILNKEQNLKLICEFDGIQHFKPVDIFGGEEGFKETKIRDSIKNEFCKDKEIPLVRIPYWEIDNIHKILGKKLYKLGLISTNKKEEE